MIFLQNFKPVRMLLKSNHDLFGRISSNEISIKEFVSKNVEIETLFANHYFTSSVSCQQSKHDLSVKMLSNLSDVNKEFKIKTWFVNQTFQIICHLSVTYLSFLSVRMLGSKHDLSVKILCHLSVRILRSKQISLHLSAVSNRKMVF